MIQRLWMVTIVSVVLTAPAAFAFETYEEAYKDCKQKYGERDYKASRASAMEAVQLAQTAEERAQAKYQAGWAAYRGGDPEGALALWGEVADDPASPTARRNAALTMKAEVALGLGKNDVAREAARKVAESEDMKPDGKWRVVAYLARTYANEKQVDEACKVITDFLENEDLSPLSQARLLGTAANFRKDAQQHDLAIELLQQVIGMEEAPAANVTYSWIEIGNIMQAQEKTEGAIQAWNTALAHPEIAPAHIQRAREALAGIHLANKEYAAARAEYQTILEVEGMPETLRNNAKLKIAEIYQKEARFDDALALCTELKTDEAASAGYKINAHMRAGEIYLEQKLYDMAQAEFQAVLDMDTRSSAKNIAKRKLAQIENLRADE